MNESGSEAHLDAAEVGDLVLLVDGRGAVGPLHLAVAPAAAAAAALHDGPHGAQQATIGDPARLALHRLDKAVRHGPHRGDGIRHLHICRRYIS
jgi:hypothetical protein